MAGAVQTPGVYQLEPDSRIVDGIEAAGGLHPDADSDSINLADYCEDASRIYIPFRGTPTAIPPTRISEALIEKDAAESKLVNLNTASASELESLPGIGPVLAERIVAYREANGPFSSPADILDVSGIGDVTFANIEARIVIE
jgi:competence protein ComEA